MVPMRVFYDDVCTALWGGHGYSLAIVSRIFFCSLRGLLPLLSCDKYDSHIWDGWERELKYHLPMSEYMWHPRKNWVCGKQASFLILYLSIIFKGYYGQNEGSFTNICNLPDFVFFKKYLNDVESITGHFCHQCNGSFFFGLNSIRLMFCALLMMTTLGWWW